jgi:hypothetical protein
MLRVGARSAPQGLARPSCCGQAQGVAAAICRRDVLPVSQSGQSGINHMKKSSQSRIKPLQLNVETIRRLSSSEIKAAVGGDVTSTVKLSVGIPCPVTFRC